jgi:hypothetical protein
MRIECFQHIFRPTHQDLSQTEQRVLIVTIVALSILTCGLFALCWLVGRYYMKPLDLQPHAPRAQLPIMPTGTHHQPLPHRESSNQFVGTGPLIEKQRDHLQKLKALAGKGEWASIGSHTTDPHSGFDWWMFPTDRISHGQGARYQLSSNDIALLQENVSFLESYRTGVKLVLGSWGWDADHHCNLQNRHPDQKWTGYTIRLAKMMHSLSLFKETRLLWSVSEFCRQNNISLAKEPWANKYLIPVCNSSLQDIQNSFNQFINELERDILSIYQGHECGFDGRRIHGRMHVVRALIFCEIMARYLFKRHQIPIDFTYLRRAIALHDAGRQGNGKDQWEGRSRQELQTHLIKQKIPQEQAVEQGRIILKGHENVSYEGILRQSGDCLDIQRACTGEIFDEQYLLFLQNSLHDEDLTFRQTLIREAKEFIDLSEGIKHDPNFNSNLGFVKHLLDIIDVNKERWPTLATIL